MADILVLGATGFTGRLITQYLYSHPDRSSFSLALGARSQHKLAQLKQELGLDDSVKTFQVDVLDEHQVEEVVKQVQVVINTVGPFYKWGTYVVQACARNGTHYVDITGETHWIRDIIEVYDYLATKTHAIIIPSSGMDSMPSDLSVYLSNKTLKTLVGPDTMIDESTSAFDVLWGASGGSIATLLSSLEDVPKLKRAMARTNFVLSNLKGVVQPLPRLLYTLPFTSPPTWGSIFIMGTVNRMIVQRTWGLKELWSRTHTEHPETERKQFTYGPQFKYSEFRVAKSKAGGVLASLGLIFGMLSLLIPPLRWLLKKVGPQSGEGPSPELQKNGWLKVTNITSSVATPTTPQRHVRTTINGSGDPGYALTSIMIAESALSILLNYSELTPLAHEGGILTPASALGDVIVRRLERSGKFRFESEIIVCGEVEEKKER
ncbi:hypothetical protein QCA50_005329 [Cerrena zonata]|uniref:Saccharopine dehydrogenase NADP binding domain-containing protein n=1 Tax=Cerrena zonata TaxID=2478898 RepID=A0AAW0GLA1_9APHY